jgi:hypothetical protein
VPVTREKLGETVAGDDQIAPYVLSSADQVAVRFLLLGGYVDGCELSGSVKSRELGGIPAIRLDAVSWPPWDEGRRDDVTVDAKVSELTVRVETAGSCLVAAPQLRILLQPLECAAYDGGSVVDDPEIWLLGPWCQDCDCNRVGMDIETHVRDRLLHGRFLRMRLLPLFVVTYRG